MNNIAFEKIWEEWLKNENVEKEINRHLQEREKFLNLIEILLKKNFQRVLEIGAGSAIDSYYLSGSSTPTFFAIDISYSAIKVAQKMKEKFEGDVKLCICNANQICFKDKSFDLVFSQGLIEHFKNPLPILTEQVRVLKKDGFLIIDVPRRYHIYTIYKHFMILRKKWIYGWETEYSKKDLYRIGKILNLKPVISLGWGYGLDLENSKRRYLSVPALIINRLFNLLEKIIPSIAQNLKPNITVVYEKI